MNPLPTIGVVVSTIGRPHDLEVLLGSLARQTHRPSCVVIVDQGTGNETEAMVEDWHGRLPLRYVRDQRRGCSRGRNLGLSHIATDVVSFPDDDSWYADTALQVAAEQFAADATIEFLSGALRQPSGTAARLRFGASTLELTKHNVWRCAIEATLFLRTPLLARIGAFNENLGVGADTPWQSGEGSELILRAIAGGSSGRFVPELVVYDGGDSVPTGERLRKVRTYARGTGYVHRMTGYSKRERAALVLRPVVKAASAAAHADLANAREAVESAIGRFEGLRG